MQRHKTKETKDHDDRHHQADGHPPHSPDAPLPPGADDRVGERAAGGRTRTEKNAGDARATDDDTPDPALVAVAERLGVEDADKLGREELLDRLSPIRHGRKR